MNHINKVFLTEMYWGLYNPFFNIGLSNPNVNANRNPEEKINQH